MVDKPGKEIRCGVIERILRAAAISSLGFKTRYIRHNTKWQGISPEIGVPQEQNLSPSATE